MRPPRSAPSASLVVRSCSRGARVDEPSSKSWSRLVGAAVVLCAAFTASTSHALTESSYSWNQNLGHVTVMMPTSEGMCFLTGMGGDYQGTGENVHIEVDDGYWVLTGASDQNSVQASAECVTWSDFDATAYSAKSWSAESYGGNSCTWPFACAPNAYTGDATLWNGTNFCSLSYVSANFDSSTWMETWYDGANWQLENDEATAGSYSIAQSTCMSLTLQHSMAFTAQYTWAAGDEPVKMLAVDKAVCALTELHGGFRGAGENVQILDEGGTWYLWGESQQPGTTVGARCVYFAQ